MNTAAHNLGSLYAPSFRRPHLFAAALCRIARRSRVVWAVLLCLCASFGAAQVSATLSGTVTDQSGAAVSDAAIAARNVDTGFSRATTTDQSGRAIK